MASKLRHSGSLFKEFLLFARAHKAYWIIPLLLVLGLILFLVVAGQASTPFIYTIF